MRIRRWSHASLAVFGTGLKLAAYSLTSVHLVGFVVFLACAAPARAQSLTFTHFAGSDGGFGSIDASGSVARFNWPAGVAVGGSGNVYVADTDNHTIRKGVPAIDDAATIDAASGAIGITRVLDTAPRTATAWEWTLIRRPSGSTAVLSSTSVENPTFTPDVADLFVFRLTASNSAGARISTVSVFVTATVPGDANGDGSVTVGDVFYLINDLFAGGPAPIGSGDANGDGSVTVGDVFYLINYLFAGGPAPLAPPAGVSATITGILGSSSFSPNPFNANAGQTIAWNNSDFTTHRILADDASFDTGNISAGSSSAAIAAPAVGSHSYHCTIHPSMVGTLVVR